MMTLIDTHAHLDMPDLKTSIDEVLEGAKNAGIEKIIVPGVTIEDTPAIIELIEKYDHLYGAAAVHPQDVDKWNDKSYETINNYLKHPKMVAVGETGLDYYWVKDNKELQQKVFREHLKLAKENNLPLIVHDRDAHNDTFEIIKDASEQGINGVMHCFSGSAEFAHMCIKIGFYVGLGGPVTFKNAKKPKEVAKQTPLDFIVIETDSPYLTPHPYRGKKPNKPEYVRFVAEEIAKLKEITPDEVCNKTTENAIKLFKLDKY